jgi:hypothetical protein
MRQGNGVCVGLQQPGCRRTATPTCWSAGTSSGSSCAAGAAPLGAAPPPAAPPAPALGPGAPPAPTPRRKAAGCCLPQHVPLEQAGSSMRTATPRQLHAMAWQAVVRASHLPFMHARAGVHGEGQASQQRHLPRGQPGAVCGVQVPAGHSAPQPCPASPDCAGRVTRPLQHKHKRPEHACNHAESGPAHCPPGDERHAISQPIRRTVVVVGTPDVGQPQPRAVLRDAGQPQGGGGA